jgi:hypothetical protein
MVALATNKPRAYAGAPLRIEENALPVAAAVIIREGSAIGITAAAGVARPVATTDLFGGFAVRKADNSAGGAGAIRVDRYQQGNIELPVTGVTATSFGVAVYASDDDTFTTTVGTNVFIGYVTRVVSAGVAIVTFNAGVLQAPA